MYFAQDFTTYYKFVAEPNVRPPAAVSPTGETTVLRGWNSARSNVTCRERNYINLHCTRSVDLKWVNNFVKWTKVYLFFFARGRGCSWSFAFPIFDISIRSGDIRNQSLKLSEIAPNFGLFLPFFDERGRSRCRTLVFRFWIYPSVPEILAIEVWSCPKSAQILHVFDSQIFFRWGEGPPNFDT